MKRQNERGSALLAIVILTVAATLGSLMMLEASQNRLKQRISYQQWDGQKILATRSLQILFGTQDKCSNLLNHISAMPGMHVLFGNGAANPTFQSLTKTWERLGIQQLNLSITDPPADEGNLATLSAALKTGRTVQLPIYYHAVDQAISSCTFPQGSVL